MIKRYVNSFSETGKIYDTDRERTVDKVLYEYNIDTDMWKMLQTVEKVRVTKKRCT